VLRTDRGERDIISTTGIGMAKNELATMFSYVSLAVSTISVSSGSASCCDETRKRQARKRRSCPDEQYGARKTDANIVPNEMHRGLTASGGRRAGDGDAP